MAFTRPRFQATMTSGSQPALDVQTRVQPARPLSTPSKGLQPWKPSMKIPSRPPSVIIARLVFNQASTPQSVPKSQTMRGTGSPFTSFRRHSSWYAT